MAETIITKPIRETVKENKMVYSYNINLYRSFPDVCDGLKPLHRRTIYAAELEGLYPSKSHTKSARLVGQVLGEWHPHGDTSVYMGLAKLSQDFYMNLPIFDGSGNWGSISGDAPAAMRYTETRMSKYGKELTENIHKNTVNWTMNYLETRKEPLTLPVKYPNLLLNGGYGIGQAYISSIPPHNVNEVIDMTIDLIKNPDKPLEEIAKQIRPDYPTGSTIINDSELTKAYETGYGNIKIRGDIEIREDKNCLVVKSIPYMVTLDTIKDKILEQVKAEKIKGISDIVDSTNKKNGIRLVIKAKKGYSLAKLEEELYKNTPLQSTLLLSLICTENDDSFRTYNIKELFTKWIDYRKTTLKRMFNNDMAKLRRRIHIIDGLLSALTDVDTITNASKTVSSKAELVEKLMAMKKFKLTELQARHIAELELWRLGSMKGLNEEKDQLNKELEDLLEYFTKPSKLDNFIIEELKEGKKKYGRDRLTTCKNLEEIEEEAIEDVKYTLFITKGGFVKKINLELNTQNRGGKGRSCGKLRKNDYIMSAGVVNNRDSLMFFTNEGRVFMTKVHEIEECGLNTLGYDIKTIINLKEGEKVINMINLSNEDFDPEYNLVFITKRGLIKKSSLSQYENIRKTGIIALKINEGDKLVSVILSKSDEDQIVMVSKLAKVARFNVEEVPLTLRDTQGVKGMDLQDEDSIIAGEARKESDNFIFVVTRNGIGKKVLIEEVSKTQRGVKGMMIAKLKSGDFMSSMKLIDISTELTVITQNKMIKVKAEDINTLLRAAQGLTIVKLEDDDKVLDVIAE